MVDKAFLVGVDELQELCDELRGYSLSVKPGSVTITQHDGANGLNGPGDYGWQPSSQGDKPVKTSVTKQLEFIRARKDAYANFAALVRLVKFWRNFHELDESLRSFTIELILSHLQDTRGVPSTLEEGLLRFFLYVADSELKTPICFKECGTPQSFPKDRVVILDPCNADNNVARKITEQNCKDIIAKCVTAWETVFLSTIWNRTDVALQKVKHIMFCGYSFPDADIHIKYLLKRAQTNRNSPLTFTVINHHPGKDPELARQEKYRYERFLGTGVDFTGGSFEEFTDNPFTVIQRAGSS